MTGTIQNAATVIISDLRHDALQLSFVNDSGITLTPGQEVMLKTDGTIDKRDAGSEIPLGIVVVAGENGKRVTVRTYFTAVIKGKAIGGAINAGVLVRPNGNKNDTTFIPEYVASTTADISVGLVIKGATQNGEILIGIMDGVFDSTTAVYPRQTLTGYTPDTTTGKSQRYCYLQNITAKAAGNACTQKDLNGVVSTFTAVAPLQPDVPRNIKITFTDGNASISAFSVLVTGTGMSGATVTETFVFANGLVQEGSVIFAKLTSIVCTALVGNGAGDTFDAGWQDKIGLPNGAQGGLTIVKLVSNAVEEAAAATDAVNGSFTPTTATNATNDYEVWYVVNSEYESLKSAFADLRAKLITAGILI